MTQLKDKRINYSHNDLYICEHAKVYSVTPKPGRWDFVNIEKIHDKYQLLMIRFIKVIHPPRYGEINWF